MAQTIPCDLCERVAADFLIGVIATGDQTGVCARCLPAFTAAISDALTMLDAGSQEPATPAQPAAGGPDEAWEGEYPQPAPKASRGRKSASNGEAAEAAEAAPAAADHE